ncbi:MAG: lamin tail domain-containing protein [Flavobacteriales bacterium]|nr:lamin tail domain-containing protein [Flavobacteriales bacterium]
MMRSLLLMTFLCTIFYTGIAQIKINEISVKPGTSSSSSTYQSLKYVGYSGRGSEYIELYNEGCGVIDLSCYYLVGHNDALNSKKGTFRFPAGASISPLGFFSIGGPLSGANINLFNYTTGNDADLLATSNGRWYLDNADGYVALYDNTGTLIDAVYWSSSANYNSNSYLGDAPPNAPNPISPGTTCGVNPGALVRPTLAEVEYAGASPSLGKVLHRITDGSGAWATNATASLNACNGACGGPCLLPVEMLSFTGDRYGDLVELNWVTATEINCDYFQIQRKSDENSIEDWVTIGQVIGGGTINYVSEYSFLDQNPKDGINYYRIKQVDFNGDFEYFGPIAVVFGQNSNDDKVVAYPIPCNNQLHISLNKFENEVVEIYDISGKKLELSIATRLDCLIVDVSDYANGQYIIKIISSARIRTGRVIIQHTTNFGLSNMD